MKDIKDIKRAKWKYESKGTTMVLVVVIAIMVHGMETWQINQKWLVLYYDRFSLHKKDGEYMGIPVRNSSNEGCTVNQDCRQVPTVSFLTECIWEKGKGAKRQRHRNMPCPCYFSR